MTYSSKYKTPCIIVTKSGGSASHHQPPHEAFANVGDNDEDFTHFEARWGKLGASEADNETFYDVPVAKRAFRNMVRAAWTGDHKALEDIQRNLRGIETKMVFTAKGLEVQSNSTWADIAMLTLRDGYAGRLGVCGNPGCTNHFFIKKRATQRFCEAGPCVQHAQRQYSLRWWNEHGNEWRDSKQKKAKKSKSRGK